MSVCGKRGCRVTAVVWVTVPSYQHYACAEHIYDVAQVVRDGKHGTHQQVTLLFLDDRCGS